MPGEITEMFYEVIPKYTTSAISKSNSQEVFQLQIHTSLILNEYNLIQNDGIEILALLGGIGVGLWFIGYIFTATIAHRLKMSYLVTALFRVRRRSYELKDVN